MRSAEGSIDRLAICGEISISVLSVGSIGLKDDFFLLGGDSLRGSELLVNVKAIFGVELPMAAPFGGAATVAGMARTIEDMRSTRRLGPGRTDDEDQHAT